MDYNLGPRKNCLVGNWSEEQALNEYAGHYRMPQDGAKGTSTYKRCVEHSLRYDVADLTTTNRKDFNEPKAPHQNLTYKPNAGIGAREQLMMQKLNAVAAAKQPPTEQPREWDTVAQTSFQWPQVDQHYRSTMGQKKMRSLDNGPLPGRDRTFLLEHRIVQPHLCLETDQGKAEGTCVCRPCLRVRTCLPGSHTQRCSESLSLRGADVQDCSNVLTFSNVPFASSPLPPPHPASRRVVTDGARHPHYDLLGKARDPPHVGADGHQPLWQGQRLLDAHQPIRPFCHQGLVGARTHRKAHTHADILRERETERQRKTTNSDTARS
jgi:hypothetical protein